MRKLNCFSLAAMVGIAVSVTAPSAMAIVNTITGTGTAQVQEYQGTGIVNSDFAFKDFDTTKTALPMTEVALRAGFGSLRRFNAAFAAAYRRPPSAIRRAAS